MIRGIIIDLSLGITFVGFFALGWWVFPAPSAWGKVLAVMALVNACIGLGYLAAWHRRKSLPLVTTPPL